MSSIPVIVSGAAEDCVPSVVIGGVEKPVYDAYVIVGGAAKLLCKRSVEWSTIKDKLPGASGTVNLSGTNFLVDFEEYSHSTPRPDRGAIFTVTFSDTIDFSPGTIGKCVSMVEQTGTGCCNIAFYDVNNNIIVQDTAYPNSSTSALQEITVATSISLKSITIKLYASFASYNRMQARLSLYPKSYQPIIEMTQTGSIS